MASAGLRAHIPNLGESVVLVDMDDDFSYIEP